MTAQIYHAFNYVSYAFYLFLIWKFPFIYSFSLQNQPHRGTVNMLVGSDTTQLQTIKNIFKVWKVTFIEEEHKRRFINFTKLFIKGGQ